MPDIFMKCLEGTRCLTEYCYNAVYKADINGVIRVPEGPYQKHHVGKLHVEGYRVVNDENWLKEHKYIQGTVSEVIEILEKKIDHKKEEIVQENRCEHRHDDGSQCKSKPKKGMKFCRWHLPKDLIKKAEIPKKRKRGRPKKNKNPRIDDDIPF